MAANIFEIIIGESLSEYSLQVQGVDFTNSTFFYVTPAEDNENNATVSNWFLHGFDSYNPLTSPVTSLNLFSEDFEPYPPSYQYLSENTEFAHSSFYFHAGWSITHFLLGNDGLGYNSNTNVEELSTTGYDFFNADSTEFGGVGELAPDLTLYGRSAYNTTLIPNRVNVWQADAIPDNIESTSSAPNYPSSISTVNNRSYLKTAYHAENFNLMEESYNYGSLVSSNEIIGNFKDTTSLRAIGTAHQRYVVLSSGAFTYVGFAAFSVDLLNNNFKSAFNFYTNQGWNFNGKQKYIGLEDRFSGIPNQDDLYKSISSEHAPIVTSFKNIFPEHTIGKNVTLTFSGGFHGLTQVEESLVGNAYTLLETHESTTYPYDYVWNHVNSSIAAYSVSANDTVLSTTDGSFYPVPPFNGDYMIGKTHLSPYAPIRDKVVTDPDGNTGSVLVIHKQNSQDSYLKAKCDFDTVQVGNRGGRYNFSINFKKSNGGSNSFKIIANRNFGASESVIIYNDSIPLTSGYAANRIIKGHFIIPPIADITSLSIEFSVVDYVEINYIRISESTYCFKKSEISQDAEGNVLPAGDWDYFNSTQGGDDAEATKITLTTSPIIQLPFYLAREHNNSNHHVKEKIFTEGSSFNVDGVGVTNIQSIVLPFHNDDKVFDGGSKIISEESYSFIPKDEDSYDEDGFPRYETGTSVAVPIEKTITLKVGSPDLHIFADSNDEETFILSNYSIKSIKFENSKNHHCSVFGTSQGQLSYQSAAQLSSGESSEGLTPIVTQGTELGIPFGETVSISVRVTSFGSSSEPLVIDTGEGTPFGLIGSLGIITIALEVQGTQLRLRSRTALEKGSAIGDTDVVVDYVRVTSGSSTDIPKKRLIKYGDETTSNADNLLDPYTSAIRVQYWNYLNDSLYQGLVPSGDLFIRSVNFPYLSVLNKANVSIVVHVPSINSETRLRIRQKQFDDILTSDMIIAGAGTHTFSVTTPITSSQPIGAVIFIDFYTTGSSGYLDVILNSIVIKTTESTPTNAKKDISLDLFEDFDVPITSSIKDFRSLDASSSDFSKTITIPATAKNKLAFEFENEISSISNKFNENVSSPKFKLKVEGINTFSGYANLLGSKLNENGFESLDINLTSGNSNWVELLKDIELKSLQSEYYDISSFNILNGAINPSLDDEIFFPMVDNGRWAFRDSENPDAVNVGWGNVKAAFSIKKVLENIFELINYRLSSNFFNENSEIDGDFSFDFASLNDRLACIAPNMSKPDFFIEKTALDISFNPSLGGGISQMSALSSGLVIIGDPVELDSRPFIPAAYLKAPSDGTGSFYGYYLNWAYIRCNIVNQDEMGAHSYEDVSGSIDGTTSNYYDPSSGLKAKLKQNNLGASKSFIQVNKSDYYDLDIAINFDLNSVGSGFLNPASVPNSLQESESKTFLTVMLVEESFAIDDTYLPLTASSFAFNAFDLYDESSVELLSTEYSDTRVSLARTQYLEQGKKYNVVVLSGSRQIQPVGIGGADQTFNHSFIVNELDLRMKASKSVAPMEGKYSCVYTDVATPRVSYLEVLPEVKAIDFISDVTKAFNLLWSVNPLTREITTEPFSDFYDFNGTSFGYKDLTDKSLITSISNNEIISGDLIYSMKEDSSDFGLKESAAGDSSVRFGDKKVNSFLGGLSNSANPFDEKEKDTVSLNIFSALKMGYAKFINRTNAGNPLSATSQAETDDLKTRSLWLPRIWSEPNSSLEPSIPEQKPNANNSHENKLCLIKGLKHTDPSFEYIDEIGLASLSLPPEIPTIHYSLTQLFSIDNSASLGSFSGLFRYSEDSSPVYLEVGSYFPFESETPSVVFSDLESNANESSSLFASYHKNLVDMLTMRDKIITAEIMLTPEEVRGVNFRQLVKIGNELYIINKIKDFNFSGEPTEVELLLVTKTGTNY
jgi:hypothetical protein